MSQIIQTSVHFGEEIDTLCNLWFTIQTSVYFGEEIDWRNVDNSPLRKQVVRRRAKQGSFLAFCPFVPIILKIKVDVVVSWSAYDQSTSFFFNGGHAQAIWKLVSQTGSLETRPSCHIKILASAINYIFWNKSLHLDNAISKPNSWIELSSLKMHSFPCCQNLTVHEFVILPFESSV